MVPPELQSIADELYRRYEDFLKQDIKGKEGLQVPDLLTAEEQVKSFVYELGRRMLQTYMSVRLDQAKAARQPCTCGLSPGVHRTTEWTRQTPFGPVSPRHEPLLSCPRRDAPKEPMSWRCSTTVA